MKNEKETAVLTAQEKENQLNELILNEFKELIKWDFDGIDDLVLKLAQVHFEFTHLLSLNSDFTSDTFAEELFTIKLLFDKLHKISDLLK